MKIMKITLVVVLVLLLGVAVWKSDLIKPAETSVITQYQPFGLTAFSNITCTYPQTMGTYGRDATIVHELSKPETNPIIMTFSDIDAQVAKLSFIDATQSISEVPVVKLVDNQEKLVFLEGNGDPYLTVHSIYKLTGLSTYAKSVSLFSTPSATIAMGTCVDS